MIKKIEPPLGYSWKNRSPTAFIIMLKAQAFIRNTVVVFWKISTDFQFYLAFENCQSKHWVTEKFYEKVNHFSVPIVLNRQIHSELIPDSAFIAADDFDTLCKLTATNDVIL